MSIAGFERGRVADMLREVSESVVLPRFRALADDQIEEKAAGDLVTVADLESEAWLTERLTDLLPGSTVVGEEAVFADETVLNRLDGPDPVWVIDPIDGTWNFAHGRDIFAIMIALVAGGQVESGWIYEPVSGRMLEGERGGGVRFDGQAVSLDERARDGLYSGTAARHLREAAERDTATIGDVFRTNCAGHEYVLIFSGERDFSAYTRLKPWDHAAGSFLIAEAGGHSALLDGARYDLARPAGYLLSANSRTAWHEIQAVLSAA
jgi:fructose-1,6-bisphosphatase/inositol monophosphatase family enzyme